MESDTGKLMERNLNEENYSYEWKMKRENKRKET